jgi:hypothetical protein
MLESGDCTGSFSDQMRQKLTQFTETFSLPRMKPSLKAFQIATVILHVVLLALGLFHPSSTFSQHIREGHFRDPLLLSLGCGLVVFFYCKTVLNATAYTEQPEIEQFALHQGLFHCETCDLDVPLRGGHCRECGRCTLRRDHHCSALGVCIGMDNHLFFFLTMVSEIFFSILNLISLKSGMIDDLPLGEWFYRSLPCTLAFGFTLILILQPILLVPFHFYLLASNRTTWEFLKGQEVTYLQGWLKPLSPFSKGFLGNCADFVTMRWRHPTYRVPRSELEMDAWKEANWCCVNDCYQC